MQIQVNTDDNVEGREELIRRVKAEVSHTLDYFSDHITRVEVHLSDEDGHKSGSNDKRCLMEARLAGLQPVAVSHHAGSLDEAFSGAAAKLKRSVGSTLGRLNDHRGRDSTLRTASEGGPPSDEPTAAPGVDR